MLAFIVAAAEPSETPAWIQAWTGVGALLAAIVAAVFAGLVYWVESKRDQVAEAERRQRAEDERRAQADKVAAWYEPYDAGELGMMFGVHSVNASDLPVYDLVARVFFVNEQPTGEWQLSDRVRVPLGRVLSPGGSAFLQIGSEGLGTDASDFERFVVGIEFRDSAGVRWARDPRGVLTELPPAQAA